MKMEKGTKEKRINERETREGELRKVEKEKHK